jgi:nucleotide-binding universal stress UspA family protein
MSQPVLVGVDGSPAARAAMVWAMGTAGALDVAVVAVHVLTYSAELARDLPPTGLTTWRHKLRDRLEHEWIPPRDDQAITVRTLLREADSVTEGLLEAAADQDAGMIVLGVHGHGDLRDRLLGGTTYRVSHTADRPVVIVPAAWEERAASHQR